MASCIPQKANDVKGRLNLVATVEQNDSDLSADTCFDMEQRACPHPATFPIPFSQRTHIVPSTYIYTSFISNLELVKSVVFGKASRQTLLFDGLLYWLHIAWSSCHHYKIESTLRTNQVHYFRFVM